MHNLLQQLNTIKAARVKKQQEYEKQKESDRIQKQKQDDELHSMKQRKSRKRFYVMEGLAIKKKQKTQETVPQH